MLSANVAQYLESHREEHLRGLVELLRFPSIANVRDRRPDGCWQAAEWLAARLNGLGFQSRVMEAAGRPNVYAQSPAVPGRPTLLVYGPTRWTCGSRPPSSRPSATGPSTPAAPATARGSSSR